MFRFVSLLVLVLSSACATARPEKLSFEEAFRTHEVRPPVRKPASARPVVANESASLQAELDHFAEASRVQRLQVQRGSAMPLEQQARWTGLVEAVDVFLARSPERTASTDVVRTRAALEAELEQDARTYGDFPAELAEEVLARVDRLAVRMALLRPRPATAPEVQPRFGWPVEPVVVTSPFGIRLHPVHGRWKEHAGIDLDAYEGQWVFAAGEGVVVRAGWNGGHGRQVEVEHAEGMITRYSHLSSILVEPGKRVLPGDPVGRAGRSGVTTGVHVHFEIWRGGQPEDPLELLGSEDGLSDEAGPPRS